MKTIILLLIASVITSCYSNKPVKNVILVIGDGMGPGQISILQQFIKHSKLYKEPNAFDRIAKRGTVGISDTAPHGKLIVDSACSATQIALGKPSLNEFIGLDLKGRKRATILEKARDKGLMTGLVSDTRLTHATPASFAAHVTNRWLEDEIAMQMIKSKTDVLLSGGANRFFPKGTQLNLGDMQITSKRKDDLNPIEIARQNKYQIIHKKEDLNLINPDKVLGLFTSGSYPSSIYFHNNEKNEKRTIASLLEMTKGALNILGNKKNKKGFFLMVEAGQIDWAGHANDAGTMLHEMVTINDVLNYLIEYVQSNPDTLLVVTADHETGSFGLGYHVENTPKPKDLDAPLFKNTKYTVNYNYGPTNVLDLLYQQKASFNKTISDFLDLKDTERTPYKFMHMINNISVFKITHEDAKRILKEKKNQFYDENSYALKHKSWPVRDEYTAYYPNLVNNISALVAQVIATKANLVWGTGGHTSNPVHVYSMGPKHWSAKIQGSLNHAKIGRILQKSLELR